MQKDTSEYLANQAAASPATQTFATYASGRLDVLCAVAGFDADERARASQVLKEALAPWGDELIGRRPRQPSDLSDDHFPLEASITFTGGEPEVRMLFEPQCASASCGARWRAARALHARLAALSGVDLARLRAIEELFEPGPGARWSAWHSLRFARNSVPKYKVYLNPEAQGAEHARVRVAEALLRLGFANYARNLSDTRSPNEELKFFSLDLDDDPRARVKVYAVQRQATRQSIARALQAAPSFSPAMFGKFWSSIAGAEGPFSALPVSTYLSLVSGDEVPSACTVHFPSRAYAPNDRVVYDRVCSLLEGTDLSTYQRAIAAFAQRPLEARSGMHAYVSLAQESGRSRVTVYLACEAYAQVGEASSGHRVERSWAEPEEHQ